MSNKGNNRHVKRLVSGRYAGVYKKESKYLAKPNPGRHTLASSISLSTTLIEKLHLASSYREAKVAINSGKVTVNGKAAKDPHMAIGFGDVISVSGTNSAHRVTIGKHSSFAMEEEKNGSNHASKVIGKYLAKKGKVLIRLGNGDTIEGKKEVSVNDSVVFDGKKLSKIIKMEKGANCLVISGTHASETGVIKEIKAGSAIVDPTVRISSAGKEFETLLDNVMATE
jgi:small subunit ribosomal protein S4e